MQHDFNLTPNGSQTIDVAGRFFKYKTGSGLIRVRTTKGGFIDLLPGQGVENETFTSLTVQDRTGVLNTGSILAGDFNFRDERISGSVEVIDGGKSRTLANQCFDGVGICTATAALYSCVQLFNPAGSGKRVVIEAVNAAAGAIVGVNILQFDTTLANLSASAPSKMIGSARSSAQIYTESRAAGVPSGLVSDALINIAASPSPTYEKKLNEPIILLPGRGVVARSGSVNVDLVIGFEFYEELI